MGRNPLMRAHTRGFLIAAAAGAAVLGSTATAMALWRVSDATDLPSIMVGDVSFGAVGQTAPGQTATPEYSADGAPVTLKLPGSVIVDVLNQTSPDPDPVFWRFSVDGYAQGVDGMDYDVSTTAQLKNGATLADLTAGPVHPDTILAQSTLKVYPASLTGDCSDVPDTPAGPAQNTYVYDGDSHVLQATEAYAGTRTTQQWCVAINFNKAPDGAYANEVQATGTAEDGTPRGAINRWEAIVAFRPSLAPLGEYVNRADVTGVAEDGTTSHASDLFNAIVYPDPSGEPDLEITLAPTVTKPTP